jgi:hypothetical protein
MTIEERLEAIAQTLELTARMQQQTERALAQVEGRTSSLEDRTASIETRTRKLEDETLVQAQLVSRFERRVDAWIESAETRMARLEVLSTAVLERIDRFIAGQERNGHGD